MINFIEIVEGKDNNFRGDCYRDVVFKKKLR